MVLSLLAVFARFQGGSSELLSDLGGIEAVSTQELALVEEAVRHQPRRNRRGEARRERFDLLRLRLHLTRFSRHGAGKG
jgi:hypothetical protein